MNILIFMEHCLQLNIKLRRFSRFSSKKTFFYIIRIKAWIRFYVEHVVIIKQNQQSGRKQSFGGVT